MDNRCLAHSLVSSLRLERPPVGLAFVSDAPPELPAVTHAAPSACTFWRRAEQGVFYAAATDHGECPIGLMTMGFEADAEAAARAQETVGLFVQLEYFSMSEVAKLPSVAREHLGIVYGPLGELPIRPDVVLIVASPFQAMLLAEAGGCMALGDSPLLSAMGRPACAAIPRSLDTGQTTMSLGCIGARTYAEIPEDRVVLAVPSDELEQMVERVSVQVKANEALQQVHQDKKAQFNRHAH